MDHRPQHDHRAGRRPYGRRPRQGRRPALSLGQSRDLRRGHRRQSDALRPARYPMDRQPAAPAPATSWSSTTAWAGTTRASTSSCRRWTPRATTPSPPAPPTARVRCTGPTMRPIRPILYSEAISGAQRLPNGNTLICDGDARHRSWKSPRRARWSGSTSIRRSTRGFCIKATKPPLDIRGHDYNAVFKVERYAPDFAGFTGRDLTPGGPVELYRDWIEIRNPGTSAVDLSGMYLTNDASHAHQVPDPRRRVDPGRRISPVLGRQPDHRRQPAHEFYLGRGGRNHHACTTSTASPASTRSPTAPRRPMSPTAATRTAPATGSP